MGVVAEGGGHGLPCYDYSLIFRNFNVPSENLAVSKK